MKGNHLTKPWFSVCGGVSSNSLAECWLLACCWCFQKEEEMWFLIEDEFARCCNFKEFWDKARELDCNPNWSTGQTVISFSPTWKRVRKQADFLRFPLTFWVVLWNEWLKLSSWCWLILIRPSSQQTRLGSKIQTSAYYLCSGGVRPIIPRWTATVQQRPQGPQCSLITT